MVGLSCACCGCPYGYKTFFLDQFSAGFDPYWKDNVTGLKTEGGICRIISNPNLGFDGYHNRESGNVYGLFSKETRFSIIDNNVKIAQWKDEPPPYSWYYSDDYHIGIGLGRSESSYDVFTVSANRNPTKNYYYWENRYWNPSAQKQEYKTKFLPLEPQTNHVFGYKLKDLKYVDGAGFFSNWKPQLGEFLIDGYVVDIITDPELLPKVELCIFYSRLQMYQPRLYDMYTMQPRPDVTVIKTDNFWFKS
jgi:hypothetical protein